MSVEIVPVRTKADTEAFLRLPWLIYRDDPAWVPNLLLLQRDVINPKKNPFFEHGQAQLFLAKRDGEVVGRISAQSDKLHNERHKENTAFFGFFESINDVEVATALIGAAESWARERGFDKLRGPFCFTINEDLGVLIEGFEYPPMIGMTHAPPYYDVLLQGLGYGKAMDLLAYRWEVSDPPARIMEAIGKTRAVKGLRLRAINMRHLHRDVDVLLDIFNDAWDRNWGHVPVTRSEARKLAGDLRLIADPKLVVIAEVDGEPAGMVVGIPNLYEAIRDFKGFLNPLSALKLIWRLKIRGVTTGRVLLFGVKRKYRTRELYGLPFLLLHELYKGALRGRYEWCEESWVLETNGRLNALLPYWNTPVYKRYRLYEKALAGNA